jgi:drug/metabolite transporter (DMT)-like permease
MSKPTPLSSSERILANAGMAASIILWGSMFPALQVLLREWDPITLTATRISLGGVVMLAFLAWREGLAAFRNLPWGMLWLVGGVCMTGYTSFMTIGISLSGAISGALISALSPVLAALVASLVYGEKLARATRWAAAAATIGGVLVALGAPGGKLELLGGEAMMLVSITMWTFYQFGCQKHLAQLTRTQTTTFTIVTASCVLWTAVPLSSLIFEHALHVNVEPDSLALVFYAAMVSSGFTILFWNYAVTKLGVAVAAVCYSLIPVVSLALTAIVIGSFPTPLQLIGGAVIVASCIAAQIAQLRRR